MATANAGRQPQQDQQLLDQRDQQAKMATMLQMLGLMQSGQQHKDQMQQHTSDTELANKTHQTDVNTQVLGSLAERQIPGATEALGGAIPALGEAQQKLQAVDAQRKALGLFPAFQAARHDPKLATSLPPVDPVTKAALDQMMGQVPQPPPIPNAGAAPGRGSLLTTGQVKDVPPPTPSIFSLNAAGGPSIDLNQLWQALKRGAASSTYGASY